MQIRWSVGRAGHDLRYHDSKGLTRMRAGILDALGGEAGCKRLSREFYARVAKEPVLRPLFPGKSLRCATEELAAFLVQFLGGDEDQTSIAGGSACASRTRVSGLI